MLVRGALSLAWIVMLVGNSAAAGAATADEFIRQIPVPQEAEDAVVSSLEGPNQEQLDFWFQTEPRSDDIIKYFATIFREPVWSARTSHWVDYALDRAGSTYLHLRLDAYFYAESEALLVLVIVLYEIPGAVVPELLPNRQHVLVLAYSQAVAKEMFDHLTAEFDRVDKWPR